jgi:hypothetical protein
VIGQRIGPYEVVAKLGQGGMGEVYRARDSKLDRDVALKILPTSLANDPERLARFEREAKTLALLNHPNIAHVYDADKSGGVVYLVMELVEGDDLSAHITRGPMPLADVVPIATQIADALEAAHEQGIVHRDLKPANIKLRADGTVKILDFGLAKALAPDSGLGARDASNSPTLTAAAFAGGTQMGVILGTAAYMAPEQARGRPVDRRADIWAFGVVLYEMLSGKRVFEGDDVSVTLANVIKEEANWDALPRNLPPAIRRLLRRCLEKDPRRRLSAIGDARLELQEFPEREGREGSQGREDVRISPWARLWPAIVGAGLAAAIAFALWPRATNASRERIQFSVPTEQATPFQMGPRISPDGRLLAYSAPLPGSNGKAAISIRSMDGLEPRVLAGTEGAANLFWSPENDAIGYEVGDVLYRVSVNGGTPRKLADVPSAAGGTWMRSGDILVASNDGYIAKLYRVPGQGGVPVEVKQPKAEGAAASYGWPVMLPDDRHFIYLGWSFLTDTRALFVGSLDGVPPTRIIAAETGPAIADGQVFFVQSGTLFSQPFNARTFVISGEQVRIVDSVLIDRLTGYPGFSASDTGVLAYRTGPAGAALMGASTLEWISRSGKSLATVGEERSYGQVRLSPDQKRVVFAASDDSSRTWLLHVLDLASGVSTPVTPQGMLAVDPVWSADSQRVAFVDMRPGNTFYTLQLGSVEAKKAFESSDSLKWPDDWAPNGSLLFHLPKPGKLFAVTPGDPGSLRQLLETTGAVDGARVSPDGKWIAYQIQETDVPQVWVASFPALDQRRQVSPQGGGQANWRGDGRELFYLTPAGKLITVQMDRHPASGAPVPAAPVELFQSPLARPQLEWAQYAATADGQRFLFQRPRPAQAIEASPITVVVNWNSGRKPQ